MLMDVGDNPKPPIEDDCRCNSSEPCSGLLLPIISLSTLFAIEKKQFAHLYSMLVFQRFLYQISEIRIGGVYLVIRSLYIQVPGSIFDSVLWAYTGVVPSIRRSSAPHRNLLIPSSLQAAPRSCLRSGSHLLPDDVQDDRSQWVASYS